MKEPIYLRVLSVLVSSLFVFRSLKQKPNRNHLKGFPAVTDLEASVWGCPALCF